MSEPGPNDPAPSGSDHQMTGNSGLQTVHVTSAGSGLIDSDFWIYGFHLLLDSSTSYVLAGARQ